MAFRIRSKCVNVEQEEYESKEKLYRDHLEKYAENKDRDLWKYFYWDTFHDGYIEKVSFGDTLGDVMLHISCPNIKKRNGDSYNYILAPIEFKCHFKDVVYFSHEYDDSEELINERYPYIEYLFSEIDTLTEIINKHYIKGEDEDGEDSEEDVVFHSLILELGGSDTSSYLEMVFSCVDVHPKEPLAFELMLASDDFYVPIYRENEDIDKLPEWISNTSGFPNIFDSLEDDEQDNALPADED